MAQYSSKELYMMNGGNTLSIYKDGFGDSYHATAEDEAAWSQEVIDRALTRIDTETNVTNLRFAINDLIYHKYKNVDQLLLEKISSTSHARTIAFATVLWTMKQYQQCFGILYQLFLNHREECLDDIFYALIDFKNNIAARRFLLNCLKEDDTQLHQKALTTLSMWSYSGMPELRAAALLDRLRSREEPDFTAAMQQLQRMLFF